MTCIIMKLREDGLGRGGNNWFNKRKLKTRCKTMMILLLSPWESEQMGVKASGKGSMINGVLVVLFFPFQLMLLSIISDKEGAPML